MLRTLWVRLVILIAVAAAVPGAEAAGPAPKLAPLVAPNPVGAEYWFTAQRAGPNGHVAPGAYMQAWQQLQADIRSGKVPVAAPRGRGPAIAGAKVVPSTISQSGWATIGPAPIGSDGPGLLNGDTFMGPPPLSGRVTSIAVQDANTVYAGAADGGV